MKIELDKIGVKTKILDDKKTKAIIGLDFGEFVIRGFRVQESQYKNYKGDLLWITPPSYQGGGRYHPMFYIPNKELWKDMEMKIWDEYYKQQKEHFKKRLDITDDDLPI